MKGYIILQSSIPIADLGDIAIIEQTDTQKMIQQKIADLHNNMLIQRNSFNCWYQQGGVLTPQQSEQLLQIQPIITAYFTYKKLHNINEEASSMEQLNEEYHKYVQSLIDAIASATDSHIVDETLVSWIKAKFMPSIP